MRHSPGAARLTSAPARQLEASPVVDGVEVGEVVELDPPASDGFPDAAAPSDAAGLSFDPFDAAVEPLRESVR